MHPTLSRANNFHDLIALEDHDAPYVYSAVFPNSNFRERSASRKSCIEMKSGERSA